MIIAIDGPAAAGKGTLARRLALHFGLAHLDTGMLYRGVARRLLDQGADPADPAQAGAAARALDPGDLARDDLRTEAVSAAASVVAAIPEVRSALLAFQRRFARHPPGGAAGAVLDGRDIGSVVCPDADIRLFVTADDETRARRRYEELRARGVPVIFAAVLRDLRERDRRDRERGAAPLTAGSAFVLDTTSLDADAAFAVALDHIRSQRAL